MKHGPDCIPPDEVGDPGMCCCNGEWDSGEDDPEHEIGCDFPDRCLMPGEHMRSECHTVEMIEAQEQQSSGDSSDV